MKIIYIPASSKRVIKEELIKEISKKLPKKIALAYSIQFKHSAEKAKKILEENHKITLFTQVLGCSKPSFPKETRAILLISNGKFHAVSLGYESKLPVFILDNNNFEKISEKEISSMEKNEKASYVNFLNVESVGILVTNKPGQQRLKRAIEFKKTLRKKSYLFLGNNLETSEFENFGLKSWVNAACPRMDLNDFRIINLDKIKDLKR